MIKEMTTEEAIMILTYNFSQMDHVPNREEVQSAHEMAVEALKKVDAMTEGMSFTREFISNHGLLYELTNEWNKRKKDIY